MLWLGGVDPFDVLPGGIEAALGMPGGPSCRGRAIDPLAEAVAKPASLPHPESPRRLLHTRKDFTAPTAYPLLLSAQNRKARWQHAREMFVFIGLNLSKGFLIWSKKILLRIGGAWTIINLKSSSCYCAGLRAKGGLSI